MEAKTREKGIRIAIDVRLTSEVYICLCADRNTREVELLR